MELCLSIDWARRKVCLQETPRLSFRVSLGDFAVQGESMNVILPDTHQFPVTIAVVDARGNPAEVQGVPSWASTDESVVIVQPAVDGKSAIVAAVGPLGHAQVAVTADADLGEGVENISGLLDVDVVASAAVSIAITPGPIEPQ